MALTYNGTDNHTLGVEWEVALVDPASRNLVPLAEEVIDKATQQSLPVRLERELLRNTVEIVTGVCTTAREAVGQISAGLSAVRQAAEDLGANVWAAGSHPFAVSEESDISDKEHYNEIIERTQYWGHQMLIWGVHIHVGIIERDRVWPIINALMTKFPHLLALSASSPGWLGKDTGYASNRTMLYQQLPTAGIPYEFEDWDHWSSYIEDQRKSGVISEESAMHFDIRPNEKYGTIELRISDAPSNLRELSALVALTHCLVVYYDHKLDRGEELPSLPHWHNTENKWRAARYGMDAIIITTRDTDEVLLRDELPVLLAELAPIAEELDCVDEIELVNEIMRSGAAYQRQRRTYEDTGSWEKVVDQTCAELATMRPPR
ncbi:glutamate--cysteine ligase [Corynebacterium epidermidicanis]|uniref:Putative glutamate--cysteine ligase 2 n=1 Tax=Corynebacterium epidermidicanis TaxID=1050174 RepID=A0A0G3GS41_9CORY|nr:glutamate--cysteine ligase [Corynebacterium epidermidicanis]AKK04016.1 carboxylate-amine ligase, YbdK family [Corynebacterium epidermidicanis]